MKNSEGIPDKIFVLKNINVHEKAKNKEEIRAISLLKIFLAITYVNNIQPMLNNNEKIFPKNTGFKPIFQTNPSNIGHIIGLDGSHNPALPKE